MSVTSGAAIRKGKTQSVTANSFGQYKSKSELLELVKGKKYDILWDDGNNYIGVLDEFELKTLTGKIHLIYWSGFEFEGSLTRIYIANEKQYSTVDGRNRYVERNKDECILTEKKVERGRNVDSQVYRSGDLGPGYKPRERHPFSSDTSFVVNNTNVITSTSSKSNEVQQNKKRKIKQTENTEKIDNNFTDLYSDHFTEEDSSDKIHSMLVENFPCSDDHTCEISKEDLNRNKKDSNPAKLSVVVEKSRKSLARCSRSVVRPDTMSVEKLTGNRWLSLEDLARDLPYGGFDESVLCVKAIQIECQQRSSTTTTTSPLPREPTLDVVVASTTHIPLQNNNSSSSEHVHIQSALYIPVSSQSTQFSQNTCWSVTKSLHRKTNDAIIKAAVGSFKPGFQSIERFLRENANKYVGLEGVSLRFGGENGDVPEFVRQNCPLKGFVRSVSVTPRLPGKPVNRINYVSDDNRAITDTSSAKAFTRTHRDMIVRQLVFPLARVDCFCQFKSDECFLLFKCVVAKSGCNEMIHANCVDVRASYFMDAMILRFVCPMCVVYLEGSGEIDRYGPGEFTHLQFKSVLTSSAIDEDFSPQNSFTADSDSIVAAAVNLSMLASHTEQPRGCDLALESHISVINLATESTAVEEDTQHEDSCFDTQTGPTAKQRANSEHQSNPVTTTPLRTDESSPPDSTSSLSVHQQSNSPQDVHVKSADVQQSSSLPSPPEATNNNNVLHTPPAAVSNSRPQQSDPDRVAIEKYGLQLRASHLASLQPSAHVHPLLVDFVMCLLQERDGLDRGDAMPSKFCQLVSVDRAEDLRSEAVVDRLASVITESDLDSLGMFYVPFRVAPSETYSLIVVDCDDSVVRFYDSRPEVKQEVAIYFECVMSALKKSRGKERFVCHFLNCSTAPCDASDSGVFVVMCAVILSGGEGLRKSAVCVAHIDSFRENILKFVSRSVLCEPCVDQDCPRHVSSSGRHSLYPALATHVK